MPTKLERSRLHATYHPATSPPTAAGRGSVAEPRARHERPRPFRWWTATKVGWLAAGLTLEGLLVGVLWHDGGMSAALGAAHLLALGMLVVGARAEVRLRAYSRLQERARGGDLLARPAAAPSGPLSDDVSLVRRVEASAPAHPRLTYVADRHALVRWQAQAIGSLRTLYDCPPAGAGRPAPTLVHGGDRVLPDGVIGREVTYRSDDGTRIPGLLLRPAERGRAHPRPAVLVIPGHGPGIAATAGLVDSYERGSAWRLARAGYVVLTVELRGFGRLGAPLGLTHEAVALNALMAGDSYRAVVARDVAAGLDALAQVPGVDPDRLGVTGCSLGGDLALTVAALRPAARVVVAQGLVDWPDRDGRRPAVRGDAHDLVADPCWVLPHENARMWFEDRWLHIAPRPMLLVNARDDVGQMERRGSWLVDRLRQTYGACGVPDAFAFRVERGHHQYFVDPALDFLARHL